VLTEVRVWLVIGLAFVQGSRDLPLLWVTQASLAEDAGMLAGCALEAEHDKQELVIGSKPQQNPRVSRVGNGRGRGPR
jgi:hypothetical protein